MLAKQPLVSVVIPCFNRWPHIQSAIESVLSQSYEATECLVIDDASTDESYAQLLAHYQDNPRVKLFRLDSNQGQSAARNHGARHAKGELLCFLDSDDRLLEESISSRVRVYEEHEDFQGISFGSKVIQGHEYSAPSHKRKGDSLTLTEYLDDKNWLHTNTFMMPVRSFIESGGFNESLRNQEDIELFIRLLAHHEARFCGMPSCVIQELDNQRARHDYHRIIEQGTLYTEAILGNEALLAKVDKETVRHLVEQDTKVLLNALYKSKRSVEFRQRLKAAVTNGHIRLEGRMVKRYCLSFFQLP